MAKKKIHIAVVMTADGNSLRPDKSFAAFVGKTKDGVIRQALKAIEGYQARAIHNATDRGYFVQVGVLTDTVQVPTQYELVPLNPIAPVD